MSTRKRKPSTTLQATAIAHAQRVYIEAAHHRALQNPHVRKNHARNVALNAQYALRCKMLGAVTLPLSRGVGITWAHGHCVAVHGEYAARFMSEARTLAGF